MTKTKFVMAFFIFPCTIAYAQDSAKGKLTFTGAVDAYYRYNLQNAKDSFHTNNYTSFTNSQNSFELGMASLKADYNIRNVEGVIDVGFGRRAEEISYNGGALNEGKNGFITLASVKQAYISYAPSSAIKFTMGKWFTHIGYEVPDAYLNRNYSMDYLFSYGPFSHTGIKMDVAASDNVSFMIGVADPTDFTSASFSKKSFLGQFHLYSANKKTNGYLNYLGGKDLFDAMINQVDIVITDTVSQKFSVVYNGSVKSVKPAAGNAHSWWGSALYLNYDLNEWSGFTARGEYFSDEKSVAGLGSNLFDITLSGNIYIDNLTVVPEFRLDAARGPLFYKNTDGIKPAIKSTSTFILAATYHF